MSDKANLIFCKRFIAGFSAISVLFLSGQLIGQIPSSPLRQVEEEPSHESANGTAASNGRPTNRLETGNVRVFVGRVVNPDGEPIADALVEWGPFDVGPSLRESTRTDRAGHYRLETVHVGPHFRLGISAPHYGPEWFDNLIPGRANNPDERTVTLRPGRAITGTVVDEAGLPLEGVTILAMSVSEGFFSSFSMPSASYPFPGPPHSETTDAQGNFHIADLPGAGMQFAIYRETKGGIQHLQDVPCGQPVRVILQRQWLATPEDSPGMVRGRVLDALTHEPIDRFRVATRYRPAQTTFHDPKGEFQLRELVAGNSYQLHVYADGYAPGVLSGLAVDIDAVEVNVAELRLSRSPSYRGRLISRGGRPIAGAEIVFGIPDQGNSSIQVFYWDQFAHYADGHMNLNHVQRMVTGEDGRFSFCEGTNKGVLAIAAPRHRKTFFGVGNRPQPDEHGEATIVLVEADGSFSGTVRQNGRLIPHAVITIWNRANGNYSIKTKSDEQGSFHVPNCEAGLYCIRVREQLENTYGVRITHQFSLADGEHRQVELGEDGGPCSLSGIGIPFCWVELSPHNGDEVFDVQGAFCNADGYFRFSGLMPGTYSLRMESIGSRITGYIGRTPLATREIQIAGDQWEDLGQLNENGP